MNVFQGEYFEFLTVYLVYFFFNLSLRDFAVLSSASWDRFSFMFPGNLTRNENWPSVDLLFYAALARQPTFNDKINIVYEGHEGKSLSRKMHFFLAVFPTLLNLRAINDSLSSTVVKNWLENYVE